MNTRDRSPVHRRQCWERLGVLILACGSALGAIACTDLFGAGPAENDYVLTSINGRPSATFNLLDSAVAATSSPDSYVYWVHDSFTFRPDGTGDRHESSRQYINGPSIGVIRFTLHNTFRYEIRGRRILVSYDPCERYCKDDCRIQCRTEYQNYDNLYFTRWGAVERRGSHDLVWHYEPVGPGAP